MPIRSVFIAGVDRQVEKMFRDRGFVLAESEEETDAIVFLGGSDLYPFLYGENPVESGWYNLARDKKEISLFKKLPSSLPKIGICRGGQLFNVLCGGSMYQDCDGHNEGRTHPMKDFVSGSIIEVSSVHHQMMIPGDGAFVIAGAQESTRRVCERHSISILRENLKNAWDDPEVLYYKNFNCLCFQGHPEQPGKELEPMRDYFFELIHTYLGNQG